MHKRTNKKHFQFLSGLVKSGSVVTIGETDFALIRQFKELEIPGNDPTFYARVVIKDWAHYNMEKYIEGEAIIWYDEDGNRHWKEN